MFNLCQLQVKNDKIKLIALVYETVELSFKNKKNNKMRFEVFNIDVMCKFIINKFYLILNLIFLLTILEIN